MTQTTNKITPFLMYNHEIGEVINFYKTIFKDFEVFYTTPGPDGIMSAELSIGGQKLMIFNGGSHFKFSDGNSLFVSCDDQAEVDYYWSALTSNGGEEGRCGWLKDRFGLSWQIIPKALGEYLGSNDRERAGKAMEAMMQMNKIEIDKLKNAFEGR